MELIHSLYARGVSGASFRSDPNDPWGGIQVHFFVDPETGFRILTEQHWVE